MAITISPELEGRLQRVVDGGRYTSVEHAMESAVQQLETKAVDDMLAAWPKADLEAAIEEGQWSLENEPLVTPEEARAHLAKVREELRRG